MPFPKGFTPDDTSTDSGGGNLTKKIWGVTKKAIDTAWDFDQAHHIDDKIRDLALSVALGKGGEAAARVIGPALRRLIPEAEKVLITRPTDTPPIPTQALPGGTPPLALGPGRAPQGPMQGENWVESHYRPPSPQTALPNASLPQLPPGRPFSPPSGPIAGPGRVGPAPGQSILEWIMAMVRAGLLR